MRIVESNSEVTMLVKSRNGIRWGIATGVVALALSGLPVSLDPDAISLDGKSALAAPGGNGKGKGNGQGKGHGQQAKAANATTHLSKDDPLHPSNLGRLNGFLHASPQALLNASANSAIGILSKTYAEALLGYAASSDETEETVTTEDLAEILAEAANKPLTGEQVLAIHEKLIETNPELAEVATAEESTDEAATETPESTEESETVDLTDPDFADQLADEANDIQATETNQGLGSSDEAESDEAESDEGGVGEAVDDAADAVAETAEDTAEVVGDFFAETF